MASVRHRERANPISRAIKLQIDDLGVVVVIWNSLEVSEIATCSLREVVPAGVRFVLDEEVEPRGGLGGVVGIGWHKPDIPGVRRRLVCRHESVVITLCLLAAVACVNIVVLTGVFEDSVGGCLTWGVTIVNLSDSMSLHGNY